MGLGLSIVLTFVAIALFAPLLTQMGLLADPTELLSNTPQNRRVLAIGLGQMCEVMMSCPGHYLALKLR